MYYFEVCLDCQPIWSIYITYFNLQKTKEAARYSLDTLNKLRLFLRLLLKLLLWLLLRQLLMMFLRRLLRLFLRQLHRYFVAQAIAQVVAQAVAQAIFLMIVSFVSLLVVLEGERHFSLILIPNFVSIFTCSQYIAFNWRCPCLLNSQRYNIGIYSQQKKNIYFNFKVGEIV